MVEHVELHGGPRHGEKMPIPSHYGDELTIEVIFPGPPRTKRSGHYTRVHAAVTHKPESNFEWAGYTTPFVVIPQES